MGDPYCSLGYIKVKRRFSWCRSLQPLNSRGDSDSAGVIAGPTAFIGKGTKASESRGAHVVLDAFSVDGCDPWVHAQGEQESVDDLMSFSTGLGQPPSNGGEVNGFSWSLFDQAVSLQTFDRANHRDV